MKESDRQKTIEVVRQYVEENFDDPVEDFTIEFDHFDGKVYRVNVVHRDDLDPDRPVYPGAGSGKSRTVLVDPSSMTVTASLRWQ